MPSWGYQLSKKRMLILDRRHFIIASAATLVAWQARGETQPETDMLPLWPGTPPGGGGPTGPEIVSGNDGLSQVSFPRLLVLRPARSNGRAVIVAAGGGYKRIELGNEAFPIARWLNRLGYTVYILIYRLPGENWAQGNLVALQDAQRALRVVRYHEKYISLLGFSAGGHLLGMAAVRRFMDSYSPVDALDRRAAYADSAALIYSVITLEKPYIHTSSHHLLVGDEASAAAESSWSIQNFINAHCPPMFLLQAVDDPIADPHNALIMQSACERHGIPVALYLLPHGGHGFGMGIAGTPTADWPTLYQRWLLEKGGHHFGKTA
jgi:acetyl esterase/lipase